MVEATQNKDEMKMFISEIADDNYFNNDQNIIRIKIVENDNVRFYDLPLIQSIDYPNPSDHYALVVTHSKILDGFDYSIRKGDPRLDLIPGYDSSTKLSTEIPWGFVWLINKRVKSGTTNYNDTSAGMFNQGASLPSNKSNVKYSLSPAINKDYTTTRSKDQGDLNNENIGVFITDNSVLIKSESASIVVGPEGISFLGDKFESHTKGGRGMMQDNPFNGWFPSTMMTIPLGIEYIPNYNFIIKVGTAAKILNKGMSSIGKLATSVKDFIKA
jgi:hypothetical protein